MIRRLPILIFLLLAALGAVWWFFSSKPVELSRELATPLLAQEVAEATGPMDSLFVTPSGLAAVSEVVGKGLDRSPERVLLLTTASHQPSEWRLLDRKERFDLVWLMGDPAEYRPLLDHLLRSADWTLVWLDPTSLLFRRQPAAEWEEVKGLAALRERFAAQPVSEQVLMKVQVAQRLVAVGKLETARQWLDEATELAPGSAPAWTQRSILYATMGRWNQALEASEKAVAADGEYLPALSAHANALYAHGKAREALALTRRLVVAMPEDGQTLYLHAKVTHAAKAYHEEVEVLRKIIEISRAHKLPLGSWHLYLAQACAKIGEGQEAIEAFEAALTDPALHPKEREFAEKGLERLRSN